MSEVLLERVEPKYASIVQDFIASQPVRVGALAARLGLKVVKSPSLRPTISGLIRPSADAEAGFEILVNKFEPAERQRFTVAHEIGHFLLHREDIGAGVVDSIMYRSGLSSRKEVEANRIAAAIVMPAEAVSDELRRLGGVDEPGVVEELAEQFRVSVPAMRIRLGIA